jgi:serine/threonine protein kinase
VAELGQGGMGRVLLAVAPDGRLVAVKQVHLELAEDAGFRARFRREVAASRKVPCCGPAQLVGFIQDLAWRLSATGQAGRTLADAPAPG